MKATGSISIVVNSTAQFLLAYFLVFLIHQGVTVLSSIFFNFPVLMDYTRIDFLNYRYSWTFDSVKIIFSSGPVISMIVSLFMIVVAFKFREYDGLLRMFFIWGFIHSFNLFAGSAVAGALLGEGFGHVLIWMFMPDTGKLVVSLIGIFALASLGFLITHLVLLTANSYFNLLDYDHRMPFMLAQLLVPYVIGSALIIAIRLPLNYYELMRLGTEAIIIIPAFLNSSGFQIFYFDESPKSQKISGSLLTAAIILIVLYRIVLNSPIKF